MLSFTACCGRPTIVVLASPRCATSTSTSHDSGSMPTRMKDWTLASTWGASLPRGHDCPKVRYPITTRPRYITPLREAEPTVQPRSRGAGPDGPAGRAGGRRLVHIPVLRGGQRRLHRPAGVQDRPQHAAAVRVVAEER